MTPDPSHLLLGGVVVLWALREVGGWASRRTQAAADATPVLEQRVTALEQWKAQQETQGRESAAVMLEVLRGVERLTEQVSSLRRDMERLEEVRRAG